MAHGKRALLLLKSSKPTSALICNVLFAFVGLKQIQRTSSVHMPIIRIHLDQNAATDKGRRQFIAGYAI